MYMKLVFPTVLQRCAHSLIINSHLTLRTKGLFYFNIVTVKPTLEFIP